MDTVKPTRSLRVIVNNLAVGGTETHLSRLLPSLVSQYGWRIKIFLLDNRIDELAKPIIEAGIEIKSPSVSDRFRFLPNFLRNLIILLKSSLLIANDFLEDRTTLTTFFLPKAYLLGMTLARLTGLPAKKILNRRSLNFYQKKTHGVRWLEKKFHRRVDAIIVNSEQIKKQLIDEEGVDSDKITLIYNGLPEVAPEYLEKSRWRRKVLTDLDLPKNSWIFIQVANLIPYKGYEDLLKALSELTPQDCANRPWHLVCLGSDSGSGYASDLKKLSCELHIDSQVHWLGKQPEVFSWYAGADIGLLSSHEEGFSNAVIEGMSVGLPMISPSNTTTVSAANTMRSGETRFLTASALLRAICIGTSPTGSPEGYVSGTSDTMTSKSTSAHSNSCLRRGLPEASTIRSFIYTIFIKIIDNIPASITPLI